MGGGGSKPPPPCKCEDATEIVINECNKAMDIGKSTAMQEFYKVSTGNSAPIIQDILKGSTAGLDQNTLDAIEKWKRIQPETIETAPLESFGNISNDGVMNWLRDAVETRHLAFSYKDDYSQKCGDNAYATISNFLTVEKNDLDKLNKYYKTYLDNYKSIFQYKQSLSSIVNQKNKEYNSVVEKIDNYKKNLYVDNRENLYKETNYEFYKNLLFYIWIAYYSLFVLYLIFSKFISDKQYTNTKMVVFIILYLLLPVILKYLINFIVYGYNYVLEINNMRDKTITYQDIVDKNK
jgi:hypothetical protein